MEFDQISYKKLEKYENLFNVCYKSNTMTKTYLDWLYFQNPLGPVVGFDAIHEGEVVAHYACIPTKVDNYVGLLSLNNATHPSFRSQGLHPKLAQMTYKLASKDFLFIIAVVNHNSASNYLKKLGFNQIGNLNLRWGRLIRVSTGVKRWTLEELEWRINSPKSKFKLSTSFSNSTYIYCRPRGIPFKLKSHILPESNLLFPESKKKIFSFGFTVDWNRNYKPIFALPKKLKPSPLLLIFKPLTDKKIQVNSWSFPDFDAY